MSRGAESAAAVAFLLNLPWLAVLVGLNLGISAFFGTKLFLPGRAWPIVKRTLKLGPTELEHEYPPRFAQALGATFLLLAAIAFITGVPTARLAARRRRRGTPDAARRDRHLRRLPPVLPALVRPVAVRADLPPHGRARPAGRPLDPARRLASTRAPARR